MGQSVDQLVSQQLLLQSNIASVFQSFSSFCQWAILSDFCQSVPLLTKHLSSR